MEACFVLFPYGVSTASPPAPIPEAGESGSKSCTTSSDRRPTLPSAIWKARPSSSLSPAKDKSPRSSPGGYSFRGICRRVLKK